MDDFAPMRTDGLCPKWDASMKNSENCDEVTVEKYSPFVIHHAHNTPTIIDTPIMSSLRLALKQSLLESEAPCVAAPAKRKQTSVPPQTAVPLVTPGKENVLTNYQGINPPLPPQESKMFSNIQCLSELASQLCVPEKALICVELSKEHCKMPGCLCKRLRIKTAMLLGWVLDKDVWCTTNIGIQSKTKLSTTDIISLVLNAFALLRVNVLLVHATMPRAKELDAHAATWPDFQKPRPMT
jgi:hypothetical protein